MSTITDISYWNGIAFSTDSLDSRINYDLLAEKSPDGVIARAGLAQAEDLRFDQNTDELRARGVWTGAYWYTVDDVSGAAQAEAFLAVLGERPFPPLLLSDGTLLPGLWLDAEDNNAGLSPSALSARYKLFLETVRAERPVELIGVYTRASFWVPNTGAPAWAANYPLWIARYSPLPLPWGNPGDQSWLDPISWDWYQLHQYEADGNGKGAEYGVKSGSIDLNKLRAGITPFVPPVEPPPTPCPPLPRMLVIRNGTKFHAEPDPGAEVNVTRDKGHVFEVLGILYVGVGETWARSVDGWARVDLVLRQLE